MIDPDLAGQNRADSAAFVPSGDGSVPTVDSGAEAIAAARADALRIVGGPGKMQKAPAPREVAGALPADAALTAAARAAAVPGGNGDCAARAQYTDAVGRAAARGVPGLSARARCRKRPEPTPAGCSLRVVNFVTPVPLGEVMDFYYSRARAAGFSAQHVLQDGDDVLGGVKGAASYVVYARRLPIGEHRGRPGHQRRLSPRRCRGAILTRLEADADARARLLHLGAGDRIGAVVGGVERRRAVVARIADRRRTAPPRRRRWSAGSS